MGSDLKRYFSRTGARVKLLKSTTVAPRWNVIRNPEEAPRIALDIRRDKLGEYFEIRTAPGGVQEIVVLNVQPQERHLVRHPDHETVTLNSWHRVLMNTENRSMAMRFLAFLD